MEKQIKTIGVLTSGGDAPGMNACIRAVVSTPIRLTAFFIRYSLTLPRGGAPEYAGTLYHTFGLFSSPSASRGKFLPVQSVGFVVSSL